MKKQSFSLIFFLIFISHLEASCNFDFSHYSDPFFTTQTTSKPKKPSLPPIKRPLPPTEDKQEDDDYDDDYDDDELPISDAPPRGMKISYELYDPLQKTPLDNLKEINYIKKILNVAVQFFENFITIRPTSKDLSKKAQKFMDGNNYCNDYKKPGQWKFQTKDLHIFIKIFDDGGAAVAHAQSCFIPNNYFPILGIMGIGRSHFSSTNKDFQRNVRVINHEILHILGFNPRVMEEKFGRDAQNHLKLGFWREKKVYFLRSPYLLQALIKHYNCPQIEGMPIQTAESDGYH